MVQKIFTFKGLTLEELKALTIEEFAKLLPSRQRRTFKRGLKDPHIILMKTVKASKDNTKPIRTHVRDMIILPDFVGRRFSIHNGKDWNNIEIRPGMIGHYLGEFAYTRKLVKHSGPGIGATRGTKFIAVK
jgi:small subunit ribosomal protein S19